MKLRSTPLIVAPLLAVLLLGGCFAGTPSAPAGGGETDAGTPSNEPETPDLVEGEPAPPGTRVGFGTYLSYPFVTTDGVEALLSMRLDSIEPATEAEMAVLVENFDSQLDGYDIYMLRMTGKKVSGGPVKFNADYTMFSVVNGAGDRIQSVTLIGWDGCKNQSLTEDYDNGAELAQCYMGAVPKGSTPPAGMAFTGGYEDDNPYDYLDGEPLLFMP